MNAIYSHAILTKDGFFDGYLLLEGGKIKAITKERPQDASIYDATDKTVCAGFIDIHTHGGGGYPFEGTVDDIVMGCNFHLLHGTTTICPTVSAAPFADMARSVENIREAMQDARLKAKILGAHLEGPYLSKKQAGAQAPDFITPPNEQEYLPLLEKHGDTIARWTYAPENDTDLKFVRALARYGVVASAGHTDAIYPDMLAAEKEGCHLVTHLYSCTSTITRDHGFRRLGVIESAFLSDDMYTEIICDGRHLPPELIRLICKIKGYDRVLLVTDSLALAGTSLTEGKMQATEFIIEDGVCKLKDRSAFAGSIATADRLVRVAVTEAGIPLRDALRMITEIPARVMGLSDRGVIAEGMAADLVCLDSALCVSDVFVDGERIS